VCVCGVVCGVCGVCVWCVCVWCVCVWGVCVWCVCVCVVCVVCVCGVCGVCVCVSPGDFIYVDCLMPCRKQKTLFFFNLCIAEENFGKIASVPNKYSTR